MRSHPENLQISSHDGKQVTVTYMYVSKLEKVDVSEPGLQGGSLIQVKT